MSSQSNTQSGDVLITAGEDLTGMEGRLVEIRNSSGAAVVNLPDNVYDVTPFVVTDGAASGSPATLTPIATGHSRRFVLKATCAPGDQIVMADPATAADKGKVRKLPTAAGTYRVIGIAEESGVDGQLVRVRPYPVGAVTV